LGGNLLFIPFIVIMNFRIFDLTHELSNEMPVFPGDSAPVIKAQYVYDKDGFQELELNLTTHTGTHIDCPLHLCKGGRSLSDLDINAFFGKAIAIDCSGVKDDITVNFIRPYRKELGKTDFILFYTGCDDWWGSEKYFRDFPVLTQEAAIYLSNFKIRGVGFDTISADPVDSSELPVHLIFLQKNILIIENLRGLKDVLHRKFFFSCFPLKITEGDGSPVRAVAYFQTNITR
jgi:arylformamidase